MNDELTLRLLLSHLIEPGEKSVAGQNLSALFDDFMNGEFGKAKASLAQGLSADRIQSELVAEATTFITPGHLHWPAWCDELQAPPLGLYVRGEIEKISLPAISIVGTRIPTEYGLKWASEFAFAAASAGYLIASGGAMGIDGAAHQSALLAGGSTLVFLASGTSQSYPAKHHNLFRQAITAGALISEVPPSEQARPHRFLARNRLIAAAGSATVVIEAAYRSGSIRTARDAAELFRMVLALPGPVDSPQSVGTNRLIADRIAELVSSSEELLELVAPLASARMAP